MFLNNQQVTEETKREIKNFLETNDNENMTTQNLQDAAKAVLRGKFIVVQSYLKIQEILNKQPNFTTRARRKKTEIQTQQKERNKKDHIRNK